MIVATLIEGKSSESRTVSECILIDLLNGGRNVNLFKIVAEVERIRTDLNETFGKNYLMDVLVRIERVSVDRLNVSVNNYLSVGLCTRISDKTGLISGVKDTVYG